VTHPVQLAAQALSERLSPGGLLFISTGAGMSRDSGIPTFRGSEGLWRQYRAEDIATPRAFRRDPKLFWEFNEVLRAHVSAALPHAGHEALTRLQETLAPAVTTRLITQNIDRLHEASGSQAVLHLHGDILRVRCPICGWADDDYPVPVPTIPPRCTCGEVLRPDIVLFEEPLPEAALKEAEQLAHNCDAMLIIGTSANVQPAASLPYLAQKHGALIVEINPHETLLTRIADQSLRGTAADVLPALVEDLLTLRSDDHA
jgi:NAD-dependent deacetylase